MIKDFFEKNNRFKIFKMLYIFSTALFVLVYAAILLKNIAKKEYKRLFCNIFAPGVTFGLCTIIRHKINRKRPYEEMNREERWHLFYTLFLLARHAKYSALVSTIVKRDSDEKTILLLTKSIISMINDNSKVLEKYHLVLHYDFGQGPLAGIISSSFLSAFPDCEIIKTPQSQNPFMQLADLFAYSELLKYKIDKGFLTKSETKFFGGIKNLKSNYLENLKKKYL